MSTVADYKILSKHIWQEQQIKMQILPGKKQYPPQIKDLIDVAWKNAKIDPTLHIFNGKVASLHGYELSGDDLIVKVQETDYKSFYGTNVKNVHQIFDPDHLANALAACVVAETTDATIIVGKRSSSMAEGKELWHIPGGTLEIPSLLHPLKPLMQTLKLPITRSSALHPILTMVRELKEEFNLDPQHIPFRLCLGIGENLQMRKPEFLCYFRLSLSSLEVKAKMSEARDADEHSQISFVPLEEIRDFCYTYPFAPIGKAAIQVYLDALQA